jgi:Zn-finger nucleic acid-binding protein
MEVEVIPVVELELKYCERCGGLWLREHGSEEVYCAACVPKMAELPVGRRRRAWRDTGGRNLEVKAACDDLYEVCLEGGNA